MKIVSLRTAILASACLGLAACASSGNTSGPSAAGAPSAEEAEMARLLMAAMAGRSPLENDDLNARVEAAGSHPLGSFENPVRANFPPGQREYLSRLRCGDGNAPDFHRVGSFGIGVYGSVIDGYEVDCGEASPGEVVIYMDMYHSGFRELDAVPGFTIVNR